MHGTLDLSTDSFRYSGSCHGSGGYEDIDQGTAVTVYDAKGVVIGTGRLDAGRGGHFLEDCTFPFEVSDLPSAKFYQVEVSHRGKVTYSRQDVIFRKVNMSLG